MPGRRQGGHPPFRRRPDDVITIIEAEGRGQGMGLAEVWRRRDLLWFLVLRDLKLRYRQTALGAVWVVLQPLATMVIFTLVFGRFAGMSSEGLPYPVWSYTGLVAWVYFANSVSRASTSVVGNVAMVEKVYFPRLVLPVAAVLSGLLDFVMASVLIGLLLAWYGIVPGPAVAAWPLFTALAVVASAGFGLWVAALNARYRDVQYVLPFITQLWLFATPIAYPLTVLPERWRPLMSLNPMAGVVDGFRWSLLSTTAPTSLFLVSGVVALAVLATGLVYFHHVQSDFADFI
jgi:lipopolysaccharide transport system permease protein